MVTGSPGASPGSLRRAFLAVTFLRWLPTGLWVPVSVLYALDRGLTLPEAGALIAVQAVVVLCLELPTGGLADTWGRRPVLVAAGAFAIAGAAALLAADSLWLFAVAAALTGVFRALDSGPLEAWYVDSALALDAGRDLTRDLSAGGVALYSGVAVGSLLSSTVAVVDGPVDPLTAIVAAALVMHVVHLAAVMVLVRERPRGDAGPWTAFRRSAATVPGTIGAGAALGWRSRPLRLLLAVEVSWGAGLVAVELLWQPRIDAIWAGGDRPWVFGLIAAGGWLCGAAGAFALPAIVRLTGGRVAAAAALLRLAQAAATLAMGLLGGLVGVVVAFLAFYAVHGASNPAHSALLHHRVGADRRATVLSLNSLVSSGSAVPAGLLVGALAATTSVSAALVVAAVVLATAAPLYVLSGEPDRDSNRPRVPPVREHAA